MPTQSPQENLESQSSLSDFESSLKKLSLEGIIVIQGLLAQRALELIAKPKQDVIHRPASIIV